MLLGNEADQIKKLNLEITRAVKNSGPTLWGISSRRAKIHLPLICQDKRV